jgi:hypothetical protein
MFEHICSRLVIKYVFKNEVTKNCQHDATAPSCRVESNTFRNGVKGGVCKFYVGTLSSIY